MIWVDPKIELLDQIDAKEIIRTIEFACRTCYQSRDLMTEDSGEKLIRSCIKRGHESILEHEKITFRVICDRAVLAEWSRHRLASYSVESQRYCAYNKDKFGNQITCVYPHWYGKGLRYAIANFEPLTMGDQMCVECFDKLSESVGEAEKAYFALLDMGLKPENARAVLPNCVKTEMVVSMNLRELRHFIKLRSSAAAHPDIVILAKELLQQLREAGLGIFFEDIEG